jgi:3-dehydroquinate dehydratase-1
MMINELIVRNTVFGSGIPKICVPVTGITEKEIYSQLEEAMDAGADLVEWRADWFKDAGEHQTVCHVLHHLRTQLADIPLLFTYRTAKEGGKGEADPAEYEDLLSRVISSGLADLADIELFSGEETVRRLVSLAKEHQVGTILSSHDFEKTPETAEMLGRFEKMKELGADLCKLAVMPQNKKDVFRLMEAAAEFTSSSHHPCVAISMSETGAVTRIAAETFGSVMTFASASRASAPGQINAGRLRELLVHLHETL